MEFTAERELLLPMAERMCLVGRNERKTFEQIGQISIQADKKKQRVLLFASNGYVSALQEAKDEKRLSVISDGECAISADLFRNLIKFADEDNRLKFKVSGNNFVREILGQKRALKVPTIPEPPVFEIASIGSPQKSFLMESEMFAKSVGAVAPCASTEEYKPVYQQLFLQFKKGKNVFVCGDGEQFAVIVNDDLLNEKQFKEEEEKKEKEKEEEEEEEESYSYILPSSQASVITNLLGDTKKIKINFGQKAYSFVTDCGLSISLSGIPLEWSEYVPYKIQLNRLEQRLFSVELSRDSFEKLVNDLEAVRDSSYERRHNAIPVILKANDSELIYQSTFTNEIDCSVPVENFQKYKEDYKKFADQYALSLLSRVPKFNECDRYELSFLGQEDIVFVRFIKGDKSSESIFFFAPIDETS